MPEELRCGSGLIPGGTKDRPFTYDIKKVRGGGTMALVVMDAGHGGNNPGAVYQGRQEKDDALALTLAVGQILEESGVEVYYTRTTDIYEAPEQKAQEGNAVRGDYFVSIHRNSSPYPNQYTGSYVIIVPSWWKARKITMSLII